jgi:DNA-binding transcriptional LysR family regulator
MRGWLPFQRIEFGTVEGILGCVRANVGVTVLPRSVVERYRAAAALRIDSFRPDPVWVDTLFVRRGDAYVGAALRAFYKELPSTAKKDGTGPSGSTKGSHVRRLRG